ncbi:hypothetical protein BGZ70_003616 [Mortierella alpina]|uniref:Uncharacterized protein n=1 Tax=Mortierella alpina TaxID=64518 RepID=A0A9P6LW87_MORAP|nr:hypothetical protein BGZ70_003616 [Mortierella alpina]
MDTSHDNTAPSDRQGNAPTEPQHSSDVADESSEWETESSEDDSASHGETDEDADDESDLSDEENLMPEQLNFGAFEAGFMGDPAWIDIESLTPAVRANRRPNIEEDTMSDFSGDEKYEPKKVHSGENGEGDNDMFDINPVEDVFSSTDDGLLTYKIRQLMLNLTRGRKERERKLKIQSSATNEGPYLHRLMVRGPDQPQEVEHSPAMSYHYQCANSLTVTPSAMGLLDDIFTISLDQIMRCGVLPRMTYETYNDRLLVTMSAGFNEDAEESVLPPYARKLRTVKATKFLKTSLYRFDQLPDSEAYVQLDEGDDPLCLTHKYGYLVHGTNGGNVVVYCTQCEEGPIEIHNDSFAGSTRQVMVNSVQLVRWPRYHRGQGTMGRNGLGGVCSYQDDEEMDQDDEDDYDEQAGYPTRSGQFDHYLIMTGNESGLFIASLPDHPDPNAQMGHGGVHAYSSHHGGHEHVYKFQEDHTWIRNGFNGEALNDARVSPNGRWIAVVGDSAKVWTIEVSHTPETEQERTLREEREQEILKDDLDTDSQYATDDSMEEVESKLGIADDPAAPRGEKRPRNPLEDNLSDSEETAAKNAKPTRIPRLLHQFGYPQEMTIPNKVLFPTKGKRTDRPWHMREYSSQYVAWNSTSTKFAHSSDVCPRVVVWSMPAREIVCCVDTGGMGYAIEFHPRLENLFAVSNWYGFVHIVDVTGCCVGDEDLIPSETHYNGQSEHGPGLVGCEGPHYEEKHDVLMLSFRGEKDRHLRILDGIRGLGWSTDGRHLYVATLRRVLRYELADDRVRIPSLFELCGRKVREWKERELNHMYTDESPMDIRRIFKPIPEEWEYVPYSVKSKLWGDLFLMRTHDE